MDDDFRISEWDHIHPRWWQVVEFFEEHANGLPKVLQGYEQRDSRVLVATIQDEIVGVLRLILVPIGPENDLPAVRISGQELLQGKAMVIIP